VSFEVGTAAYDRFMGRYSIPLATPFADFAGVVEGLRVLDVGCGPGALTAELVRRVGATATAAVDPSDTFLRAVQGRYPLSDVRRSPAERLPFDDHAFDATLAQLVVHFMDEPVVGLREMARVTVDDGIVAACVWDHESGGGPLTLFWEAAHGLDASVRGESRLAGARQGHLGQLFREAGLNHVEETLLAVSVEHPSFDDWWEPYTLGVGPAGKYVQGLDRAGQTQLRERCHQMLPTPPFTVTAEAWAARGLA
jgi:SAM-dependent methyltransferase